MTTTVLKVGGSLLVRPDFPQRLRTVLADPGIGRPLLIVGGGAATDVVRDWDRMHALGDEAAHELAIQSLRLTAALLVQLVPKAIVCADREAVDVAWRAGRWPVLDVPGFLEVEERCPKRHRVSGSVAERLPRAWDVTSDSIAAWIAARWPAEELLLLKSTALPAGIGWDEAAAREFVDAWFPRVAPSVRRIRWVCP